VTGLDRLFTLERRLGDAVAGILPGSTPAPA
jgi:hypothetical protein